MWIATVSVSEAPLSSVTVNSRVRLSPALLLGVTKVGDIALASLRVMREPVS